MLAFEITAEVHRNLDVFTVVTGVHEFTLSKKYVLSLCFTEWRRRLVKP